MKLCTTLGLIRRTIKTGVKEGHGRGRVLGGGKWVVRVRGMTESAAMCGEMACDLL